MKKIILVILVIFSIVISAFLAVDSSNSPSKNNEGLRKIDAGVTEPNGLVITFRLNSILFTWNFEKVRE